VALIFVVLQKRVLALGTAAFGALIALEGVMLLAFSFTAVRDLMSPYLEGLAPPAIFLAAWVLLAFSGYRRQIRGKSKDDEDDD
jgi:hypothetical protein